MKGSRIRKCQFDGLWEGQKPRCIAVTCPDINSFFENGNGAAKVISNTFRGKVKKMLIFFNVLVRFQTSCKGCLISFLSEFFFICNPTYLPNVQMFFRCLFVWGFFFSTLDGESNHSNSNLAI